MCGLLEKKLIFIDQYVSITKRMRGTLEDKTVTNPESFVSQRQACIHKIQKIDAAIGAIRAKDSDKLRQVPGKLRGTISGYLEEIRDLVETAHLIDKEVIAMVKAGKDKVKTELLGIQEVRRVAKGYREEREMPPRFLDTRR